MASIAIEGWDQLGKRLDALGPKRALPLLRVAIDMGTRRLTSELRDRWLSGPTDSSHVSPRSGKLRQSIRPVPAVISGTEVSGGIAAGVKYAKVHIGPRGKVWTIRPKNKQYLTIPLAGAQAGVGGNIKDAFNEQLSTRTSVGGAASGAFVHTFFAPSRKGGLILYGQRAYQKGAKQGQARGEIVPLFLLVRQVRIKTRVPLDMLSQWIGKEIGRQVLRGLVKMEVTPNA